MTRYDDCEWKIFCHRSTEKQKTWRIPVINPYQHKTVKMSDRSESGSKRASEDGHAVTDEDEEPCKPMRNDLHVDLRVLLPSEAAGAIIGKGGENIKRLRNNYKASISVPDCPGPERILSVSGKVDVVCTILRDVIPTISQRLKPGEVSDREEVRLLIPDAHIGRILGVGGTQIKSLREETGSQITIYDRCAPLSTERVVQVTGSMRQITGCIGAMYETMEGAKPNNPSTYYDPTNFETEFISLYGGFANTEDKEEKSLAVAVGGMSMSRTSRSGGNADKVTTSQVVIPKEMAGAILGKGGNHIKQVQKESGTKIKLSDASVNSVERVISITGTQEQIQYAQYLIEMTIKKHSGTSTKGE